MLPTLRDGRGWTRPSRSGSPRWRPSSRCGKTKQVTPQLSNSASLCPLSPATADKVTNAISDPSASDMKLEDLEAHLNSLKEMFIQKQKMMDSMNPPTQA